MLCATWTGPPLPPGDSKVVIWPPNRPDAHLDFWGQPYTGYDHDAGACKWFASWSQRPDDVPTANCTFEVTLRIYHGPNSHTDYVRHVRLRIAGGPLAIEKKQEAYESPGVVFLMHRSGNSDNPAEADQDVNQYPWYCTDFDYNPFDYRAAALGGYTIAHQQRCNIFKAKPLWTQPEDVSIKWFVGGTGTFLNPNPQLESVGGSANPQETKPLAPTVEQLITMNGELDSIEPFLLTASYFNGTPTGPPYTNPITTDQTGSFYALQDELDNKLYRHGGDYAKFKPHKPKIHGLRDQSELLGDNRYIDDGLTLGMQFLYALDDTEDNGMPGVWMQERFIGAHDGGDAIPSWFITNFKSGVKWFTMRRNNPAGSRDGVFSGVDQMSMDIWWLETGPFLFYHEYWAATDDAQEDLVNYRWRFVPNTNPQIKRYLGMFIESFDMDFWEFYDYGVEHFLGDRHSGDGPPP